MEWVMKALSFSYFFFLCSLLHATSGSAGVTVGSDKQVQKVARTRFLGGKNTIARFAEMFDGFQFGNSSTVCTFDSSFPVYGDLDLKKGQLILNRNLVLEGAADIVSLGDITANGNSFYLSESMSSFGTVSDGTITFDAMNLILRSDITLNADLKFTGNSSIIGNGHILTFGPTGSIVVGSNGSLRFKNVFVQGIEATDITCQDDTASIILDDVFWSQNADFMFDAGSLSFKNKVKMSAVDDYVFAYQSNQTSTVQSDSQLAFSLNFTFSYDPVDHSNKGLLEFQDQTAALVLNESTLHSTGTGMDLLGGTFIVKGLSTVSCESGLFVDAGGDSFDLNRGISLGDGNAANDMRCFVNAGAELYVQSGALRYKNVLSNSWSMGDTTSRMRVGSNARFYAHQNLNLGQGKAVFESNALLYTALGKKITGPLIPKGRLSRLQFTE